MNRRRWPQPGWGGPLPGRITAQAPTCCRARERLRCSRLLWAFLEADARGSMSGPLLTRRARLTRTLGYFNRLDEDVARLPFIYPPPPHRTGPAPDPRTAALSLEHT